ncbi:NAD(P)-binding protein [Testicularia cyperi]|uniref:NAD(P)-binding protein n=1 Tax=Testicularia cyperi TaxID=1882483 RepID=A0A317XTM7_9BASI|nr:NAD(P)-binding protein [Testicularia cyperi]
MADLVTSNDPRKVVVITGCSSGLGRSMAIEFDAQKQYRVFATARNPDSLRELPAGIERVQLDVTDQQSIKAAFDNITHETNGRIDILVNNAGVNHAVGPLVETDLQRIRNTFEPNFFGLIAVTQAAAPYMIKRRSGTIVNIGSTAAIANMPFGATYSASKAAVHALSDVLRLELAGFGIKVVVVAPGKIKSSIGDTGSSHISLPHDSAYKHVEDIVQYRAQFSQLGNPTPTDVFAKTVRKWVAVANPGPYLFTGSKSLTVWIAYYLPTWMKDRLIGAMFNASRIGKTGPKDKNV